MRITREQSGRRMFAALAISAATILAIALGIAETRRAPSGAARTDAKPPQLVIPDPRVSPDHIVVAPPSDSAAPTEPDNTIFVDPAGIDSAAFGRKESQPVLSPEFAMALAEPGDTIHLAAGRYAPFEVIGAADVRIVGEGGQTVIGGSGYDLEAGIRVRDSTNVTIENSLVENVLWGVVIEASTKVNIRSMVIENIGQEALVVSHNSSEVLVQRNEIRHTGKRPGSNAEFPYATFGEGIYLGTGGRLPDGQLDETNGVIIDGNRISFTTAEAIDIKASVTDVTITDNIIHDIETATSGVVVVSIGPRQFPNANVLIERNILFRLSTSSRWSDGIAIRLSAPAVVRENVIWGTTHAGILIDDDLTSAEAATVLVEHNAVFSTGGAPISDLSPVDGLVAVTVGSNYIDERAAAVLGPLPADESDINLRLLVEALRAATS